MLTTLPPPFALRYGSAALPPYQAERPAPAQAAADGVAERPAHADVEALERVDGTEDLRERCTLRRDVEAHVPLRALAGGEQPVRAAGERVAVGLEAMAQPRLHDPLVTLHLGEQPVHVGHELGIDLGRVGRDDRREEHAAEARCGLRRQHERAERDAARRREGPRVPHLELGERRPHGAPTLGAADGVG